MCVTDSDGVRRIPAALSSVGRLGSAVGKNDRPPPPSSIPRFLAVYLLLQAGAAEIFEVN